MLRTLFSALGVMFAALLVFSASFLGNVVHYEIKAGSGSSTFRVEGEPAMPFDTGAEVVMSFRPEDTLAVPRS